MTSRPVLPESQDHAREVLIGFPSNDTRWSMRSETFIADGHSKQKWLFKVDFAIDHKQARAPIPFWLFLEEILSGALLASALLSSVWHVCLHR